MSKTNIPQKVMRLLWLRAAGRCEFEGCNKILYEGDITKEYGTLENYAISLEIRQMVLVVVKNQNHWHKI